MSEETRPIIVKSGYYRTTLENPRDESAGFHPHPWTMSCTFVAGCKDAPFTSLCVPGRKQPDEKRWLGLHFSFAVAASGGTYPKLPHSRILYTRCTHAYICIRKHELHIYTYVNTMTSARARAQASMQARGSPPFCTTSWKLGMASDVLVSPGSKGGESRRITRCKEYEPRGARCKTGHSRLLSGFG